MKRLVTCQRATAGLLQAVLGELPALGQSAQLAGRLIAMIDFLLDDLPDGRRIPDDARYAAELGVVVDGPRLADAAAHDYPDGVEGSRRHAHALPSRHLGRDIVPEHARTVVPLPDTPPALPRLQRK